MKQLYEKAFTRDFTLAMLQTWYKGEAHNPKPWNNVQQKFLPYIVFWRKDGTVHSYYDPRGIEWIKNEIKQQIKNPEFLKQLEENVREKLKAIQPIYEAEEALSKQDLLKFINNFEDAYTWVETLWWLCHLHEEGNIECTELDSIIELRKQTDKLSSGTDIVVRKSLVTLFPQIKDYIHVLTVEEITTETFPALERLQKRDKSFLYTDNILFFDKKEIEQKFNLTIQEDSNKEVIELKGSCAFPGKINGKVRRIMGHQDLDSIQEGEILVSPMTMPDFIVAMDKAAAFVTDEGGILCHAAVIAREMHKPCIVGTKIATAVLKNGDLIEVDADNGIIRKIILLPTQQQCLEYFNQYKVPGNIKQHCLAVQKLAVFLAKKLHTAGAPINVELVRAGSLLHDLFKMAGIKDISNRQFHEYQFSEEELEMREQLIQKYPNIFENQIAHEIFKDEFPELAKTLLHEGDPYSRQRNWEESVIHYADYRIFQEAIVSLDERFAYFKQRYHAPEGFWDEYLQYCKKEEAKIFEQLDFTPDQLKQKVEEAHARE